MWLCKWLEFAPVTDTWILPLKFSFRVVNWVFLLVCKFYQVEISLLRNLLLELLGRFPLGSLANNPYFNICIYMTAIHNCSKWVYEHQLGHLSSVDWRGWYGRDVNCDSLLPQIWGKTKVTVVTLTQQQLPCPLSWLLSVLVIICTSQNARRTDWHFQDHDSHCLYLLDQLFPRKICSFWIFP